MARRTDPSLESSVSLDDVCLDLLWRTLHSADGVHADCPRCGRRRRFHRVRSRQSYSCDSCGWHIHPTATTVFDRSHVRLSLWFRAVAMLAPDPASLTAAMLARDLHVTPRTASRMRREIVDVLSAETGTPHLSSLEQVAPSGGAPARPRLAPDVQRELLLLIAQAMEPDGSTLRLLSPSDRLLRARDNEARRRVALFAERGDARERILAATCRAIVKRGMGATRISDIAREAAVSPGIVHYYFDTKDAVLLEAARWVERETVAERDRIVRSTGTAVEKMGRFLEAQRVRHELSWQEIIVYIGLWGRAIRSPRYRVESTRGRAQWKSYFHEMIAQGIEEGAFTLRAPVDDVVERLAAFLDGISIQILVGHPWLSEERAADLTYDFFADQLGVSAAALRAAAEPDQPEPPKRAGGRRKAGGRA